MSFVIPFVSFDIRVVFFNVQFDVARAFAQQFSHASDDAFGVGLVLAG